MYAIAAATDAGHHRPSNEDRFVIDPAAGFAVVADGMGGERGGEVAAEHACAAIAELVRGGLILPHAMAAAAERVRALSPPDADGMGATVAAMRLADGSAEIAHVGDVRVYLVRPSRAPPSAAPRYCPAVTLTSGATLACLTRDHSSICELVERGHVEPGAAARHPLRGRVSRALGRADARADLVALPLVAGDRLLICSDGLWSAVAGEAIGAIVEHASPQAACDALIAAALAGSGADNITAVVVHWHGRRRFLETLR